MVTSQPLFQIFPVFRSNQVFKPAPHGTHQCELLLPVDVDQFVVLGCDGLWAEFTASDAVQYVAQAFEVMLAKEFAKQNKPVLTGLPRCPQALRRCQVPHSRRTNTGQCVADAYRGSTTHRAQADVRTVTAQLIKEAVVVQCRFARPLPTLTVLCQTRRAKDNCSAIIVHFGLSPAAKDMLAEAAT